MMCSSAALEQMCSMAALDLIPLIIVLRAA